MKKVLGIETSCDDTSICLLEGDMRVSKIYYHKSFSQEDLLKKWGGVVPEIAARQHVTKLKFLIKDMIEETQIPLEEIDLIGVTALPGLLGPLLTGLNTAKTLALNYEKPIVPVNHLYAHLEAIHIDQTISYPYLGLLVSGGHSLISLVKSPTEFKILASTVDDAAGEAFDKGGKMMKMSYPAGKEIDDLAKKGDPKAFSFSIALPASEQMSFSGLKTALNRLLQEDPQLIEEKTSHQNLCASYQEAIIQTLLKKVLKQFNKYPLPIVIGGGVACNSRLRKVFQESFKQVAVVTPQYCTDNAAMVANYALINQKEAISFPGCLEIQARNRFIDKKDYIQSS